MTNKFMPKLGTVHLGALLALPFVGAIGCSDAGTSAPVEAIQSTEVPASATAGTTGETGVVSPTDSAAPTSTGATTTDSGLDADEETVAAGSDEADETNAFCKVREVMIDNCIVCHGEPLAGAAPMPLLTVDDFHAMGKLNPDRAVYELTGERIHASTNPMPPAPGELSAEELAILDGWIEAGAPAPADPTCAGYRDPADVVEEEFQWPEGCDESNIYTLLTYASPGSDQPYMVPGNTESHPRFDFDAPWGDVPVQMVAYRPITGEGNVAHHWILYSTGGGFGFGQFLISWSPGKDESHGLPDNVGVYFPSGRGSMYLDMHYYNLGNNEAVPDRTGLEVCVSEDFKEYTATVSTLMASATVPPGGRTENESTCTVSLTGNEPVHIASSSPHMHGLGVQSKLVLNRGGEQTVLLDKPFDFDDQTIYSLDNLEVKNGDQLTFTCIFENNTDRTVSFGPDTSDEMCLNFLMVWPMGAFSCR